ncbi:hypothetical protein GGD81_000799 [Rhodobium orientis]|uniref:Uncharacterized protein n=1 Tax=Rhodobium orientis TaxID=34017 RepID=A0A327JS12_9HYPH|nr:hypothetical protein [Rhodobium orientis]MBB4301782.1 hypothetical protein [Rhodobium orientis]MBK5950581.1 hypothetical protein [Rhodobium orientis]RAI28223.1 hypothetical protein CH339_07715 [Rhodobium orientis]
MRRRLFRSLRSLSNSLNVVGAIVVLASLFIGIMETSDWLRLPTATATVQAVTVKCAMSYKVGKYDRKKSVVDCGEVGAIKAKAPDLNWKVGKVSFATLVYRPGGGKLVIDDFALTALHRDSVAVGEKLTVYYRPARPDVAVGGPTWKWFRGLAELTGLGALILAGAWLLRKAAFWFLTDEEKLAVEAVKKARSTDSLGSRLGKALVAMPLAFFGTFGLYVGGALMLAAGIGYGIISYGESASVSTMATVTGIREVCDISYKKGTFSSVARTVDCADAVAEMAKLPQVRWKTTRRTEVGFAYTAGDGAMRTAKKTTRRDIEKFPGVGGQIRVQYPESRPASVSIAPDAGLMRSLLWFLAISTGFFVVGLICRPVLKRFEKRQAEAFEDKATKVYLSLAITRMAKDAGFADVPEAPRHGDGAQRPPRNAAPRSHAPEPGGGFGRRMTT